MGSSLFFLILVTLAAAFKGGGHGNIRDAATRAKADAEIKKRKAAQTGHPDDARAAAQAQKDADSLTKAASLHTEAQQAPRPWPQQVPSGLAPFPSGWQPYEPPPQAVQTRAWQLLAPLWKKGAGSIKTEKTQGVWVTYQAQQMGKKRGVVAFRQRADAGIAA